MPDGVNLGFIGNNLDRRAAARMDPDWLAAQLAHPDSRFVMFFGDRPLIDVSGEGLRVARFEKSRIDSFSLASAPVLLGEAPNQPMLFAVQSTLTEPPADWPESLKLIDLRSLAMQGALPEEELGMLAQARSLLHWHERHQFCAVCGEHTNMMEGGYRRQCPSCNSDHFPRTDPVVIIVVISNGKCLLGRGANFPEGVYSALAGFMEPGETLEDAARREVFEESNIRVGKIDYLLSQPWPFPSSLMIGLIGEALNEDIVIDPAELEDARWFELSELKAMMAGEHPDLVSAPTRMAIAHHLVIETIRRLSAPDTQR